MNCVVQRLKTPICCVYNVSYLASYVRNVETQIVAHAPLRLWQYISLPRGWPSEDEAGKTRGGYLENRIPRRDGSKWRHHL